MECITSTADAWENFVSNNFSKIDKCEEDEPLENKKIAPIASDIYISTKTMIGYLNQPINLQEVFWKLHVSPYQTRSNCILKKQLKVNCNEKKEVVELEKHISEEKNNNDINKSNIMSIDIISKIDNPTARKVTFKDVRKINIGMTKKDINCIRKKKKGAFYNCFVLVLRIKFKEVFREIHIKVFNTGKLEIPGIQTDDLLWITLDNLVRILQPHIETHLEYKRENIHSVLINSNFSANFYINRDKLSQTLKYKYKIHTAFDPCSYPGIQCKFYYNEINPQNMGICNCPNRCNKKGTGKKINDCREISFMIFRTGSILVVGNCDEKVIHIIYGFLVKPLREEYNDICIPGVVVKKNKKNKKRRKKIILVAKNKVD